MKGKIGNKYVGKKYKIRYGNWVSDGFYEVIDNDYYDYVIGFNSKYISTRDNRYIFGWSNSLYNYRSGGKYDKFWNVSEKNLVEYNKVIEIE